MRYYLFTLLLFSSTFIFSQDICQFATFGGYRYFIDGQPISKQEVKEMLTEYPEAINDWNRAKTADILTWSLLGAEMGFAVWTGVRAAENNSTGLPVLGLLSTGIGAVIFSFRSRKLRQRALLSQNRLNNLDLSLNSDGVGLQLKF